VRHSTNSGRLRVEALSAITASPEALASSAEAGSATPVTGRRTSLVVIPTYNERENLESIVSAVVHLGHDVLLVDDNSPDGTGALADRLARSSDRVRVLHRREKLGLGTAYQAGFRVGVERGYEFIVEMDADGSHHPSELAGIIAAAREIGGLAIGSRYIAGGKTLGWSLERRVLSRLANAICRAVLGRAIHDWTSGYRCYATQAFERVKLDHMFSRGFAFQIEGAYRCLQNGIRVAEVPITFMDRELGTSKASDAEIWEALQCVLRLRTTRSRLRQPDARYHQEAS
jgi:dolichol-phosphate mannosyltransferase